MVIIIMKIVEQLDKIVKDLVKVQTPKPVKKPEQPTPSESK